MDLKEGSFVLLFLIAVGTSQKSAGIESTPNDNQHVDPYQTEKLKLEIEHLSDDPLLKIKGFEKIVGNVARQLKDMDEIETDDMIISVRVFTLARFDQKEVLKDLRGKTKSRIHIPTEKIRKTLQGRHAKELTVVEVWWKNISSFPRPQNAILPQNSTALSVSYFLGQDTGAYEKESLPVDYYVDLQNDFTEIMSLKSNERLRGFIRTCAWLDVSTNQWNESGCIATYDEFGVNCVCDHTTTFVTLLTLDKNVVATEEVLAVTMAFEIATIMCLLLTIIFIWVARQGAGIDSMFTPQVTGMNANRTNSQVSLCLSLLGMHLVIVWSNFVRNRSNTGCVATTVLTHYFLLASAFWSFCEGVGVFVKVCPPLTMIVPYRVMTISQAIVGWAVPLLITLVTAVYGIKHGTYMDEAFAYTHLQNRTYELNSTSVTTPQYDRCWLSKTTGKIWAAIGPIIFILVINLAIMCYVTNEVVRMKRTYPIRNLEINESQYGSSNSNTIRREPPPTPTKPSNMYLTSDGASVPVGVVTKQRQTTKYMVSVTRTFGVLMPILAVPWILAILSNFPDDDVASIFSTAHALINGLQGLQIFLLYCVVNEKDWRIVKRKWRNSGFRRLFSKYHYNRRDSIATTSTRVVYRPKYHTSKLDSNGNAFSNAGYKAPGNVTNYDTMSCRSSSGTSTSTQNEKSSMTKLANWWKNGRTRT